MNLAVSFAILLYILFGFNDLAKKNPNYSGDEYETNMKSPPIAVRLYHPCILLTDSTLNSLKNQAKTDILLQRYVNDVISEANTVLSASLPEYNKDDIWYTTEMTRQYITQLSLAYRWTGDVKYAVAAKKFMLNAINFPDWTPIPGFLQTSEMTCAIALGYDWLYNWLDQPSRLAVENAILKFGLNEYLLSNVERPWNTKTPFNFGIVTNSSMLVGAVAVGNIYPDILKKVIQIAAANLAIPLKSYAPDGAWPEGINYWGFSTIYACYGIETLKSTTGTDLGLCKIPGLSNAGYFPIYTLGPNSTRLCFADDATYFIGDEPTKSLFWLGKIFNNPFFINEEHRLLKKKKADPLHVVFYSPPQSVTRTKPLDKFFSGSMPLITFRSAWDDPQSLFLGAKGGRNMDEHAHLDLGNFELEALGMQWAIDLGRDDYNLPGYFDNQTLNKSKRWTYYRCNSHSHNVPMINNKDQLVAGDAVIISHSENVEEPHITFDLTRAYSHDANSVIREIKIINNRKAVQVTDVFNLKEQSDIYWGMTTPAFIHILDNGEALLSMRGKSLIARIASPSGLSFYSESCYQAPPQNANSGFSRLMVKTNHPEGVISLIITLTPNY